MTDDPLLSYSNELSFKLNRPPATIEEDGKFWDALAQSYMTLFRGNPAGFYLRHDDGSYHAIMGEVTTQNWIAHLLNMPDSGLVIVPVTPTGRCSFAAIDMDRHGEQDEPVKWDVLARVITEKNLPLVVVRSGGNKGAHLFCFFRERETEILAVDAIRIMKHYVKILDLPANTEIFPKQTEAKGLGNGINAPYHFVRSEEPGFFANNPVAFDANGIELDLWEDFLTFAWERSVFGAVVLRDLPDAGPAYELAVNTPSQRPIKAAAAREEYGKSLVKLREAPEGEGNKILFQTAKDAGKVLKGLGKTLDEVKAELLHVVTEEWKRPHDRTEAQGTIASGLTSGIAETRAVVFPPTLPWQNSRHAVTITKSPAIIENMLYAAATHALIGKVKLGKTTLCLDAAECIIYGRSFLKEEVVSGSVLYVSEQPLGSFVAELNNSGLVESGQMVLGSPPALGQFEYVCIEHWFKLPWTDIVEAALEQALKIGAKLIIFDTLSRIARIENENDASEVQQAIDVLTPFLEHGIATLFVSHERKSGGDISDAGRGSSAIVGSVDVILRLTKPTGKHPDSYRQLDFIGRFPGPGPKVLERKTADSSSRYTVLGNMAAVQGMNAQQSVMDTLKNADEEYTLSQIVEETEGKRSTTQRAVEKLVEAGLVLKSGDGSKGTPFKYRLKGMPF